MVKALIIDDEKHCSDNLQWQLNQYCPEVELVAICNSAEEGLNEIYRKQPQLVFLDVEMPGMSGFEMLEKLTELNFDIVFTTAFNQYAIRAIKFGALDYLVKPIAFSRFLKAVNKAKDFILLKQKDNSSENVTYFFLKVDNRFEKINYDDILFAEALQNYVAIHTTEKKMLSYITFSQVEKQLPADRFIKVHKSYIVAFDKIKSVEGNIINIAQHQIPVSRGMKDEVMQKIVFDKLIKR